MATNQRTAVPRLSGESPVHDPLPGAGTLPYGEGPLFLPSFKPTRSPPQAAPATRPGQGKSTDSPDGTSCSGSFECTAECVPSTLPAERSGEFQMTPSGLAPPSWTPTPFPAVDEQAERGIVLTLGWIEQVLRLSFDAKVEVRVAGVGTKFKIGLDEGQVVDIVSSMAHYVRRAMPNGGLLTVHAMPVKIEQGEATQRLGVEAGKYVFLGISHTLKADSAGSFDYEPPERARVSLHNCIELVEGLGGSLKVDQKVDGMVAMNIYLPAYD